MLDGKEMYAAHMQRFPLPLSLCDISYTMPTLGEVAGSRQQEQSLLTWKVHLFPKYTATSRDLSSYAQ